jgi:hypothetical protein
VRHLLKAVLLADRQIEFTHSEGVAHKHPLNG